MSYFKYLPKTTFTLSTGQSIDAVNIFKSIVLSPSIKENSNFTKRVFYNEVKRIENVSYKEYSNNLSLYWLVLSLNNIDSFSKVPYSQSLFETTHRNTYQGKVYYIKNAKNTVDILPNDLVLLQAGDDWKVGGIVKEYDSIFRRIILKKEVTNTENLNPLTDETMLLYRKLNESSSSYVLYNDSLERGRVEDEYEKTIKLYDKTSLGSEISPYQTASGNFNFSNDPTAGEDENPLLVDLCNDTLTGYKLYTFMEEQFTLNSSYKNLRFTNTALAFKLNSFLSKISSEDFERGQVIKVS